MTGRYWLAVLTPLLAAAPAHAAPAASLTPAAVAARLQQRFDQIHDYDCVLQTETRAGARVEDAAFHLWYCQPGLLRLRVLRGRHRGSELVVGPDGVLRGRRGGLLKPFSRRLDRSDPSLRSLRGQPAWKLDFGSFLHAMLDRMALPASASIARPTTGGDPRLILEVRYCPPGAATPLRDVWFVDPAQWLLEGGDVFEGETRVDHVEFTQIHLNTRLKESWFRF